jgi:secreted PhoX family phosphatase
LFCIIKLLLQMKKNVLLSCMLLGTAYVAVAQTPPCTPHKLHFSRFTSVLPSAQPDSLRIPSTHTFQMLTQEGRPYTDPAQGTVRTLFDFAGYVPVNGSSTNGYVSLNHEGGSTPTAGVSILDIEFNPVNKLWNVKQTNLVDFTGTALSGTGRNCSGGVTPWATSVTCEETLPSGDANADGYQDIGWCVEVNPVTRSVVDYNGDGKADKIWKMGRMSHENMVVSADSSVAYEANDENPGYVFKYVMKQKGNLSDGDLYVLKLDGALGSINVGAWVKIPNSTPTECNNVRTAANSAGATNFNSLEDVEISPLDGMIYFTSKASSRVYRFRDYGSTVGNLDVFCGNPSQQYLIDYGTGTAYEQWRDGNDNLTFDEYGNLYVIQDGGRNHIWMVSPCHTQAQPDVKLFAVIPDGAEPTGMTFSPDYRYAFLSIQHPDAANAVVMRDAADSNVVFNKESLIVIARRGYLGKDTLEDTTTPNAIVDVNGTHNVAIANLYPNPTSSDLTLTINAPMSIAADIRVYGITGALVMTKKLRLEAGTTELVLDTEQLPAGTYSILLSTENGMVRSKFVKQ